MRRIWILFTLAILCIAPHLASVGEKQAGGRRFALLVGCTRYDNMTTRKLEGPANDVLLMSKVLQDTFAFPERHITILSEARGGEQRPLRKHIEREFLRLRDLVKAGDQVVVLLAGHGTQVPDQAPFDEPDGLDEAFMPADVGTWDAKRTFLPNVILDDELHAWTKAISDKGARVWMIIDSCHSGTGLRGGDHEVVREADPVKDLGIPQLAMDEARKKAGLRDKNAQPDSFHVAGLTPGVVGTYACQPFDLTYESPMPPETDSKTRHGILTYALCQILTERQSPITYRELAQRIHMRYLAWGRQGPLPLAEGADLDREILGQKSWPGRSRFTLTEISPVLWRMNGGRIHGLTEGSIVAVFPPAGSPNADRTVGHARIQSVGVMDCRVMPCDFDGMKAPRSLPEGGSCELVFLDYGEMRIRVAIAKTPAIAELETELKSIASSRDGPITIVDDPAMAQWILLEREGKPYLLPGDVARLTPAPRSLAGLPAFRIGNDRESHPLEECLIRVARAQNLLALANVPTDQSAARADKASRPFISSLQLETLKLRDKADTVGEPIHWQQGGLTLKHGDFIAWRFTNRGPREMDVSLLFLDSKLNLEAAFPRPNTTADNRIEPGKQLWVGPVRVNAEKSTGLEHLIVVAVENRGPPMDFTYLAQPTLRSAEEAKVRGDAKKTRNSSLGKVLESALFTPSVRSGTSASTPDTHALYRLSWRVSPCK